MPRLPDRPELLLLLPRDVLRVDPLLLLEGEDRTVPLLEELEPEDRLDDDARAGCLELLRDWVALAGALRRLGCVLAFGAEVRLSVVRRAVDVRVCRSEPDDDRVVTAPLDADPREFIIGALADSFEFDRLVVPLLELPRDDELRVVPLLLPDLRDEDRVVDPLRED